MKMYQEKALQDESEIAAFCSMVQREGVRSYLEIGSKFGGSLWRVAKSMPRGSVVVAVDLPGGTKSWRESEASLKECLADLRADGYYTHAVWGDSRDRKVIDVVSQLGPYDLILIDGDHRMPGVTADWNNYSPMGKRIAFHDIAWKRAPGWVGTRIDVPQFWASIKGAYTSEEFVMCPTKKNNGIGVLWR